MFGKIFGRKRKEGDFKTEIEAHIQMEAERLREQGLSEEDARAAAHRAFGNVTKTQERFYESRRWLFWDSLSRDIRFALRMLRKSPGFTTVAVLSLALGMGATSAIYTAVDAVLWKPLPVENPQRLVDFSVVRDRREPAEYLPAAFASQLQEANIFEGLTTRDGDGLSFSYGDDSRAERIMGGAVSPNYFDVMGVKPILGEGFSADVRRGRWAAEAVLSYNFWKERFDGDPRALGRTIRLNTYPFTIVGVAPPSLPMIERGVDYQLCIPVLTPGRQISQIELISGDLQREIGAVARLKNGSTLAQAQAAVDAQFQEFLRTTPI